MSRGLNLKVFISVDMEGVSGIVDWSQVGGDKAEYEKGRKLMVGDVNAAIEGVLSSCEAEVVVSDGHGGMKNLQPEELKESAILVRGSPKPLTQMAGINEVFDAAVFVGYHPKKGTRQGILCHTISGSIDSITINGLEIGETAINAAIAGYHGVPLVFVSGDLAVTKEAKELDPEIVTVAVKKAVARNAAECVHPVKARAMIKKGVSEAINKRGLVKPFAFQPPIEAEVKYATAVMADAVEFMPSAERVDGRRVKFVSDDYLKVFKAVRASIYIAGSVAN